MLFLIVHYWEVMVDVWPVIVQVCISSKQSVKSRQACHNAGNGQGKIEILQVHGNVREFCLSQGKLKL